MLFPTIPAFTHIFLTSSNTTMTNLIIEESNKTPAIFFDYQNGKLDIIGYRSMPESPTQFYTPILEWVTKYVLKPKALSTEVTIKLEYFNTATGKCFVEILKKLDKLPLLGHPVFLKWYYEEDDEDMAQSADDIQASIKFVRIEKISYH